PPPPNLAVTAIRASDDRIVASLRNTGDTIRVTRARLKLDGRPAGETPATVGPHSSVDVEFAIVSKAESAAVAVDDETGPEADNTRYAVIGTNARPELLILTPSGSLEQDAFYVRHALVAGSADRTFRLRAAAPAALQAPNALRAPDEAAVFL